MTTPSMPKAKTERLIVREIDGETLVYDRGRDAASCLNEFAARVWRECDGETSVAAIAAALGEDERAVWLALHQLTKAQLLTEAIAFPPDMSAAKSRREIGERLGLSAASPASSCRCQHKLPAVARLARLARGDLALARAVLGSCAFLRRLLVRIVSSSERRASADGPGAASGGAGGARHGRYAHRDAKARSRSTATSTSRPISRSTPGGRSRA